MKIDDIVKIISVNGSDKYLIGKSGKIIKITDDNDWRYGNIHVRLDHGPDIYSFHEEELKIIC